MILLTNDDGVSGAGLLALANAFYGIGAPLFVVAPDQERSAIGHGMTFKRPLTLTPFRGAYPESVPVYSCNGTPTDCVIIGLDEVKPETSLVVSGINYGPNVGDDLTYSGTVSAAMEGLLSGRNSVAVSLSVRDGDSAPHYDTAAVVALRVYHWIQFHGLPIGVMLNVNVPNLAEKELKGIRLTRKGVRYYHNRVRRLTKADGTRSYWMGGDISDDLEPGTDVEALSQGCVSVTPIHLDMTHYPSLKQMVDIEKI